jgi:hypothetical protein
METLSLIPMISQFISKEMNTLNTQHSLRKLFLLECRRNMKLLDITKWDKCPVEIRNTVIRGLNNDAAKAYFSFAETGFLGALSKAAKSALKKEEAHDAQLDDNITVSLITRIDALKFLAELPDEHLTKSNPNFTLRIKNLKAVTLEAMEILQHQVST